MSQPLDKTDPKPTMEFNFFVLLANPQRVNHAWLEKQAMAMEEALIEEGAGVFLGPSVSVNFDQNGWEIDLTIESETYPDAEQKFNQAMGIVERVGEISLDQEETEVRKTYHSEGREDTHQAAELVC
ncbi:MAG: hypothetical protein JSS97_05775 [Actinobacteria bacterium]|nr:hypothetical protein [Actinomycetota bacterium]